VALHAVGRSGALHDRFELARRRVHPRRRRLLGQQLPKLTDQPLEIATFFGTKDFSDRFVLERNGWLVRHAVDVAGTAEAYRSYVQSSRGEFSCAKPSCVRFRNAWISDRTLCYLASGKPAVVQDTGPSSYVPDGDGLHRFSTPEEAAAAIDAVNGAYERNCRAARELAETYFDATEIARSIVETALQPPVRSAPILGRTAPT
jgi:glycosyltransferase involved in cell wall biosynthesis